MIKRVLVTVLICLTIKGFSQKDINDYKYLIIPTKYDFLKGKDKYRLNTLTRFLFKKKGYKTYFDEEELPKDLFENRCLAMYADVIKHKGFLSTKLQIELRDCKGELILVSQIGKTKEKDYAKAYNIALRQAFETFEFMDYSYKPSSDQSLITNEPKSENNSISLEDKKEIERLKKEVETLKVERDSMKSDTKLEAKESLENKMKNEIVEQEVKVTEHKSELLFAQPIDKGFQIINMKPEIVMILLNTANKDMYKVEGKEAIVFKKGGQWIYAETLDSKTTEKIINIRF